MTCSTPYAQRRAATQAPTRPGERDTTFSLCLWHERPDSIQQPANTRLCRVCERSSCRAADTDAQPGRTHGLGRPTRSSSNAESSLPVSELPIKPALVSVHHNGRLQRLVLASPAPARERATSSTCVERLQARLCVAVICYQRALKVHRRAASVAPPTRHDRANAQTRDSEQRRGSATLVATSDRAAP